MNKQFNISDFQSLSVPEKMDFLDCHFVGSIKALDEKSLNVVLRSIILDEKENMYVRKSSLELFTELVIVGKLKTRHALSLLIDDWVSCTDVFLELQRIKDLVLYYEESREEIESIFMESTGNIEAEIAGESFMNLGVIFLQKALQSNNKDELISTLDKSAFHFQKSLETIENRVDSKFYQKVILILQELVTNKWGAAKQYIKELGNSLFQREVFSLNFDLNNLQYNFYKILSSLQKICNQRPTEWLDYRFELDNMFLCYADVTSLKLEHRLSEKQIIKDLGSHLKKNVLEPYFAVNFRSEITKLDVRLREMPKGTAEHDFLFYLKSLIVNSDKKKVELKSLETGLINLFPHYNPIAISKMVGEISNPIDCFNAFELLARKSNDKLISDIVFSCAKLQGDKNYWGKDADENERNKYLANLLEARDYTIKDQTQWSKSSAGKKSGEIDIFITEKDGTPKSIIEALILDSLKSDYLIEHLDKLFNYDTTGLECNFILTYSVAKNYANLWDKYKDFISKHEYMYAFIDFHEIEDFNFTDIKIGFANHSRNGKVIRLYHIIVNLIESDLS